MNELSAMLEQARVLGVSEHSEVNKLTGVKSSNLEASWAEFLADNPDFEDGSFEADATENAIDVEQAVNFKDLVVKAVGSLASSSAWKNAQIGKSYVRYYDIGEEGTGWHDDVNTGSDIVAIHTRFGDANFGAIKNDGASFNHDLSQGSVVVIASSTMHFASGPIDGAREIEGVPIRLNG